MHPTEASRVLSRREPRRPDARPHPRDASCCASRSATPRPRSSASRRGSAPARRPARSTPSSSAGALRGACTRCARRRAAPTSTSAGRTARPRSSSAASSAPAAATSARSTPASPPSSTATSRRGRRVGAPDGPALLDGHRRRPRRPAPTAASWLYAETVRQIHALNPGTGVELLIPDFNGRDDQLGPVFDAAPEVLAHNLETVPRIFKRIRPGVPLRALAST